ncbi:MAG: sporulation protein YabP [Ruminiclostridium sp.]|nr:sporulation protein YabP [Ruminiclostridium sp.]
MNSSVTIDDRERMIITGVKSVESVTDTLITLFTAAGDLVIKGERLETGEFDPAGGIMRISGRIDSLAYTTEKYHLPDNIISRLFR